MKKIKSLTVGIVKDIKPIGQNDPRLVRPMENERIVFHLVSRHPVFHYDQDYGCKPEERTDCDSCPYRFECFTVSGKPGDAASRDIIQIEFKGDIIGVFPSYWKTPEPTANELEAYLWGESNGRLQMRTSRGGSWR